MSSNTGVAALEPNLQIGHVLFMDVVGYSKLPLEAQTRTIENLQRAVRQSTEYQRADNDHRVVRLPTGDGMALVFFGDPLSAVRCALDIAAVAKRGEAPELRIGIHSGPVYVVEDINGHKNVAGSGVNIAQRVMDVGDAGHILLSQAVAEVLQQLEAWAGSVEFLGEAAVKHEVRLPIYSLQRDGLGNAERPAKLAKSPIPSATPAAQARAWWIAGATLLVLAVVLGLLLMRRGSTGPGASPQTKLEIRKITTSGKIGLAAISPDGKYVVYEEKTAGSSSALFMKHLVSGSTTQILPAQELRLERLVFSPDGNYIYYSRAENDKEAVYQLPVLGGTARKILQDARSISFAPDGKRAAFQTPVRAADPSKQQSFLTLKIGSIGGSEEKTLASDGFLDTGTGVPSWSPDAKIIARPIAKTIDGKPFHGIQSFPVSGGPGNLIPFAGSVDKVEWLPKGNALLMVASGPSADAPNQIWYQPYPSGPARRVTQDLDNYADIDITADGQSLMAIRAVSLYTTSVAGADQEFTDVSSNSADRLAGWTKQGNLLIVADDRHLVEMSADGQRRREIFEDDQGIVRPSACGDGAHIVYARPGGVGYEVWRVDSDGGNPVRLAAGTHADVVCSPDGQWVAFSRPGPLSTPWRVNIDGRSLTQLSQEDCMLPQISPDGKQVACMSIGEGGWFVRAILRAAGGPVNASREFPRIPGILAKWSPDGRSIAYVKADHGKRDVWLQPLNGGAPHRLTNLGMAGMMGFWWSPDGRKLAITKRIVSRDIVLITGFAAGIE